MKIVSSKEMREIDRVSSERFGVPSLTLMENAGTAVAEYVASHFPDARRVGMVCGKGNNGGDGFVAARKLQESGKEVYVILLGDSGELHGDAAEMFSKLSVKPALIHSSEDLHGQAAKAVLEADVLIDAILGTGFRPPVKGLYAEAISALNAAKSPVVAVDIPSGADADAMGKQDGLIARTQGIVTFTAPRPAHVFSALTEGPIVVAPIGSPEVAIISDLNLYMTTPADLAPLMKPRPRDSNKGMYGHVLVIGGSVGKGGAAAMAGMSALRAGAGLVTVATAKSLLPTVAGFYPELMTEPLMETEAGTISFGALKNGKLDGLADKKTVLAIGPGISRYPETSELVRGVVARYKLPIVLDADGLNAFEGKSEELNGKGRSIVITPHPGEMARLIGGSVKDVQQDRVKIARDFANEHELIVVLKGDRTLIAAPDGRTWVNTTGNPGLSTGGTGDILTGLVAGLVAQHTDCIVEAVTAAVYLHGLAGDIAAEALGEPSLVATDLLKFLHFAFRRIQQAHA